MLDRHPRSKGLVCVVVVVALGLVGAWSGARADGEGDDAREKVELTLENLFPEDGLYGPSAMDMAFSHDGRFATYRYRPYKERRHGSDLWLIDFEGDGEPVRLTSVSVMAEFQASTRNVRDDRVKKAEKELERLREKEAEKRAEEEGEDDADGDGNEDEGNGNGDEEKEEETESERDELRRLLGVEHLADWVSEKDADDDDAPRYAGISTFTWSPERDELLFVSQGDVYRMKMDGREITRLTSTRDGVRDVQYLPDGRGFTYMQGSALMRVVFGRTLIEQIDPTLPSGESMSGYRLSPDGRRMVFLTTKGESWTTGATRVSIARYRGRFMDVQQTWRQLPDDEYPEREIGVYVHQFNSPETERGELKKVHTYTQRAPRDIVRVPHWSPDSSRVVFSVFEQDSGHVKILESAFSEDEEDEETEEEVERQLAYADGDSNDGEVDNGADRDQPTPEEGGKDTTPRFEVDDARVVYRFLHTGGPNTPRYIEPRYAHDSRRIVFLSEKSGFRHLHLLDPIYEHVEQVTRGRFEMRPFDMSDDHRAVFAVAPAEHPTRDDVYRVDLESGEMTRLSRLDGRHERVAVSPDGTRMLASFTRYGQPRELVLTKDGKDEAQVLTDSHPSKTLELLSVRPEFFSYRNRQGHEIHGSMFKPTDWTEADKRPLLIYVYGGPLQSGRRQVFDGNYSAPVYGFARYMAEVHGYVTVTIDPRGVSGYGGVFEKANFEQVGRPQTEDLVDGVEYLVANHGVDPERVGMHGWSFGGFQTQKSMYTRPDVFKVGIAGAGPTEWHNYNMWYATGTIDRNPEGGKTDLTDYSLLPLAKNLEGKLLLVHGMEDSNVLFQDTIRIYAELLKHGKETLVELFLDPSGGHGLGGHVKTLGRYRKYEEFLLRTLGTGEPTPPKDEEDEASEEGAEDDDALEDAVSVDEGDAQTDGGDEEDEREEPASSVPAMTVGW